MAAQGSIDWWLLLSVFTGSTLVIASACVLNNYLDQDIDQQMARTKTRPLTSGEVPGWAAIVFSIILGIAGLIILWGFTNKLVVLVGLIGFIDYIWLYGMLSKRLSWHGTLVGSISGATPILAGYVAASNAIDLGAILVFLVLFFWQMPEFYSIAIYRRDEYAAASIPVITVVKGSNQTVKYIFGYTLAFTLSSLGLWFWEYAGLTYGILMLIAGGYWSYLGWQGLSSNNLEMWAKKMFHFSLFILLLFCLLISINSLLP